MPTPGRDDVEARDFFDAIAGRYDREYALDRDATRARMTAVLAHLAPRSRVLDLGVGTGRELPALLDAGHHVTGLDASPAMLARCARRARPVPLVEADLWASLPFPDASFEAVVALHGTLAHPPPAAAAPLASLAREIRRVLDARPASGSVFVAEAPAAALLDVIDAGGFANARRVGPEAFEHVDEATGARVVARVLTVDAWRAAFTRAGFARVAIEPMSSVEHLVVARLHP